jgi:hypothetical protein
MNDALTEQEALSIGAPVQAGDSVALLLAKLAAGGAGGRAPLAPTFIPLLSGGTLIPAFWEIPVDVFTQVGSPSAAEGGQILNDTGGVLFTFFMGDDLAAVFQAVTGLSCFWVDTAGSKPAHIRVQSLVHPHPGGPLPCVLGVLGSLSNNNHTMDLTLLPPSPPSSVTGAESLHLGPGWASLASIIRYNTHGADPVYDVTVAGVTSGVSIYLPLAAPRGPLEAMIIAPRPGVTMEVQLWGSPGLVANIYQL